MDAEMEGDEEGEYEEEEEEEGDYNVEYVEDFEPSDDEEDLEDVATEILQKYEKIQGRTKHNLLFILIDLILKLSLFGYFANHTLCCRTQEAQGRKQLHQQGYEKERY